MGEPDWDRLAEELASLSEVEEVRRERPIGLETTYRVGGAARVGLTLGASAGTETVVALAQMLAAHHVEVLMVGNGSNLLVADAGFNGVALWLGSGYDWITIDGLVMKAGASAKLPMMARQSAAAGLSGFEWAVGVPGSLGGAVRMNAGGHGSDMAAVLRKAEVVDLRLGSVQQWTPEELEFGYRCSALADHHLVLWAELGLAVGDVGASQAEITEIVAWRREHQPGGQNAGSVFVNPENDSAGRVIDAAGLRGHRWGSASVSDKHANFFIADQGGSADDLYGLMCDVAHQVEARFGFLLQPETRLVGFSGGPWDRSEP